MVFKKNKKKTDKFTADEIFKKYSDHPTQGDKLKKYSEWSAFYEGHHYGDDVPVDRITAAMEGESVQHKSKLNFILPNAHIAVSNLLKESPTPLGIPTGSDLKDKQAARVVTDLCTNMYDQNERNLLSDIWGATLNSYKCEVGYVHSYWDKDKYAIVTKGGNSLKKGDWRTAVYDPHEIFPDPSATKFEDLGWIIRVYMADVDELKDAFPKVADQINEATSDEIASSRYQSNPEREYMASETIKNRALVLEYLERPNAKHSKGRKVVVISKTILAYEGDNPDADLGHLYSIPYTPFTWNKTPEKFHGNSGVKDQIPIQKEINFVASLIMKNLRLTAGHIFLLPKGGGIKESQITGEPQTLYFNPLGGVGPSVVGGTPQPGYVLEYLRFLISTQGDIAGIREVSKAQIPERGSRMPAALYKMMQDTEAVMFSHNMRALRTSMKLLTMRNLKLMREHWDERRYLNILGKDKGYALKAFEKSNLVGSWDVTLKIGSALNNSPAARIETAMNLWDREILQLAEQGDPAAIKQLDVIEFGDMKPFIAKRKMQIDRANRFMETLIKKKKVPDILMVYDEAIFIDTLMEYMLTKEYEEDMDDEMKNIFEEAVKLLDKNKLAKEQQKQKAMQPPQQQQAAPPPVMPGGGMPMAPMQPGMPVEGMPPEGMPPGQGGGM